MAIRYDFGDQLTVTLKQLSSDYEHLRDLCSGVGLKTAVVLYEGDATTSFEDLDLNLKKYIECVRGPKRVQTSCTLTQEISENSTLKIC